MKFWELISIFRCDESQLQGLLEDYADRKYAEWLKDISNIITQQQRDKLDAIVPIDLCMVALKSHKGNLYKTGSTVRSYRLNVNDTQVSYLEVFLLFGGSFLEEVLEKGSANAENG